MYLSMLCHENLYQVYVVLLMRVLASEEDDDDDINAISRLCCCLDFPCALNISSGESPTTKHTQQSFTANSSPLSGCCNKCSDWGMEV